MLQFLLLLACPLISTFESVVAVELVADQLSSTQTVIQSRSNTAGLSEDANLQADAVFDRYLHRLDVHQDVHAEPKFRIHVQPPRTTSMDGLKEATATNPSAANPSSANPSPSSAEWYRVMAPNGTLLECQFPTTAALLQSMARGSLEEDAAVQHQEQQRDVQQQKEQVFARLEPLMSQCLLLYTGFWTYEYCHGRYLKQFHLPSDRQDATMEYQLGQVPDDQPLRPDDLHLHHDTTARVDYASTVMTGGTFCDLTGKPRQATIRFRCDPSPSSAQPDEIVSIQESATCTYVMQIKSGRLCSVPGFQHHRAHEDVHSIQCRRILTAEAWEREKELLKERERVVRERELKKKQEAEKRNVDVPGKSGDVKPDLMDTFRDALKSVLQELRGKQKGGREKEAHSVDARREEL